MVPRSTVEQIISNCIHRVRSSPFSMENSFMAIEDINGLDSTHSSRPVLRGMSVTNRWARPSYRDQTACVLLWRFSGLLHVKILNGLVSLVCNLVDRSSTLRCEISGKGLGELVFSTWKIEGWLRLRKSDFSCDDHGKVLLQHAST